MTVADLISKRSKPLPTGTPALSATQVVELLKLIPGWEHPGGAITRTFKFANYYETMAFVNAIAWIAHHEDHHPDMEVHYNNCVVTYSTHSVAGLSENDFICAAKVNALVK